MSVAPPPIIRSVAELRALTATWHRAGERIGLVPTMGALHAGHLSLVAAAKAAADRVVVTIFVNPRQFNDPEDYARYPRTEASDAEKLAPFGVDAVYVPAPDQVYPDGFATTVSVAGVTEGLCGASRPGHFDGVATVVAKLFLQSGADIAFFGEKDYQQLQLVKRLARDLDIPIEVAGHPTVREADGLALSSRNAQLSTSARQMAPALYAALVGAAGRIRAGDAVPGVLDDTARRITAAGYQRVEYLELRSAQGLHPMIRLDQPARLLVAAWLDGVRLIDNIAVGP
ncbi:pantoate--beta-alanine ligase [Halovulum dunhuangense]|uniref:Pantothenate synthetase n=1 Tax=Halovulum dunhuangense TaxID=1505036 RepID=A0A849KYQ9_9RHOB|nr:pantoate--beta-alanine ligase [Halovulum dunhuangense]NNU78862.1 pantoate--beta-alanine ligase [Halovulum dunhuangense]